MSLGSSLSATLGLNISKFRKGLADASASATTWRKGLQKNLGEMGGGNLAGLLGVAGLMQGFSAATREAQRLRDEWRIKALSSASILSGMQEYELKRLGGYIGDIYDALLSGELTMPSKDGE